MIATDVGGGDSVPGGTISPLLDVDEEFSPGSAVFFSGVVVVVVPDVDSDPSVVGTGVADDDDFLASLDSSSFLSLALASMSCCRGKEKTLG